MYGVEELYEPDEILMDVDTRFENYRDDDLHELSFETAHEASEGMSLLLDEVESPEELFNLS
jgi:hypothetical protein